ncbi:hypothetical protein D593_0206 [Streptococcus intermedius BA1]|jgi:hypothetical protein|nr:hypothetical protein D593_0206 [Streptococcus intermedius BA1]
MNLSVMYGSYREKSLKKQKVVSFTMLKSVAILREKVYNRYVER